jgi:NTP pyrophosphatase (non-canonical NTP hydrolase)
MTLQLTQKQIDVRNAVQLLQDHCHDASYTSGWWVNKDGSSIKSNPLTFSNKLLLVVSEICESMEADRKDLMDDHLPHLKGRTVELADGLIRIFDLCGGYDLDVANAFIEKIAYNQQRPDHKKEAREAVGGKQY